MSLATQMKRKGAVKPSKKNNNKGSKYVSIESVESRAKNREEKDEKKHIDAIRNKIGKKGKSLRQIPEKKLKIDLNSQKRFSIKRLVEKYLRSYASTHHDTFIERPVWERANLIFPTIFNKLDLEILFTDEELIEIESDSRLDPVVAFKQEYLRDNEDLLIDIPAKLRLFNILLKTLPESFRTIRSKLLQSSNLVIRSNVYNNMYFLPHEAALFGGNMLRDIQIYNNELSKLKTQPQIDVFNTVISAERIFTPEVSVEPISINNLRKKVKDVAIKLIIDTAEVNTDSDAESINDAYLDVRKHVSEYRDAIRTKLSQIDGSPFVDITDEEINFFILYKENLPYLLFLTNYISSEDRNVDKLLRLYPEIPIQFGRLFKKLGPDLQQDFIYKVMAGPYKSFLEFPNKPFSEVLIKQYKSNNIIPVSILSILISYYNNLLKPITDQGNDKLATGTADEALDIIKTLTSDRLLHYRDIIFSRINIFSKSNINQILALYNPLLLTPESELFGESNDNIRLETIQIGDNYIIQKVVYPSQSNEILNVNGIQVTRPSQPVKSLLTSMDFILPDNQDTRKHIFTLLNLQLPSLVKYLNLVKDLSIDDITKVIYIINDKKYTIYDYIIYILYKYYNSQIPIYSDFVSFLKESILTIINDAISQNVQEINNISEQSIQISNGFSEKLQEELDDEELEAQMTVSIRDIETKLKGLGVYGINLTMISAISQIENEVYEKIKMARDKNLANAKTEEEKNRIKTKYLDEIKDIEDIKNSYKKLERIYNQHNTDFKEGRRALNRMYDNILKQYKKESRQAGIELTPDVINELEEKTWNEITSLPPDQLPLSLEEIEMYSATMSKSKVYINKIKKRLDLDLRKTVKSMPDAMKQSLQTLIDNISTRMENVSQAKKEETKSYYQFVAEIIAIMTKSNYRSNLEELRKKYSNSLIKTDFKDRIFTLLENGTKVSDILSFTTNYISGQVKLLKNPLIRNTNRRALRYQSRLPSTELELIRRSIPVTYSPLVRECISIHMLKPWIDLPKISNWTFAVAHSSGKSRDQVDNDIKNYFNLPTKRQLIVNINGPDGKKSYYFYRPTMAYWIKHCQTYHVENDKPVCNVDDLLNNFSISSPNAQFYEIIFKAPVKGKLDKNGNLIVNYIEDTSNFIFLSGNPSIYQKECQWFSRHYQSIDSMVYEYAQKTVDKENQTLYIRAAGVKLLKNLLSSLRMVQGLTGDDQLDLHRATALERSIVNYMNKPNFTVFEYLKEIFTIIIFSDPREPIVGNNAYFYSGLLARCAEAYFPVLLKQYNTSDTRFPELFLNRSIDDSIKLKFNNYINQKIPLMINDYIINTIGSIRSDVPSLSIFSDQANNLVTELPSYKGASLRNICVNINDYDGVQDSWLMYYQYNQDVYCISKLELAKMAMSGIYEHEGIKFSKEFVDQFKNYSAFTASELQQYNTFIKEAVSDLTTTNKELFMNLVDSYATNGPITSDDLLTIGFFDRFTISKITDAQVIYLATERINDLIQSYIYEDITKKTSEYIMTHKEYILKFVTDKYALYHADNPISSSNFISVSMMGREEFDQYILNPLTDIIIRELNDIILYPFNAKSKTIIKNVINALINKEFYNTSNIMSCQLCKSRASQKSISVDVTSDGKISEQKMELCEDCIKKYSDSSLICDVCNSKNRKYTTIVQDSTGNKILNFCSSKCFSNYKVSDPTRETISFTKKQNALKVLLAPYLSYPEMIVWARFPREFNIPKDTDEQKAMIDILAKIKGSDTLYIKDQLTNLPVDENALGIFTIDANGIPISASELWERIIVNPKFVISEAEVMDNEEKYNALEYLARKYNVPMMDYSNARLVYRMDPIPGYIREVWKSLRSNQDFQDLLFSIITTFDPEKNQARPPHASLQDVIDQTPTKIKKTKVENENIYDAIKRVVTNLVEKEPNLGDFLVDGNYFKSFRNKIMIDLSNKFPSLQLKPHKRDEIYLKRLKKAMGAWFNNHIDAYLNKTPLVREILVPDTMTERRTIYGIISTDELLKQLNQKCKRFIEKDLHIWTYDFIKNSNITHSRKAFYPFWTRFINDFNCTYLKQLDSRYNDHLFELEKINSIIDEIIAHILEERQPEFIIPPNPSGLEIRAGGKRIKRKNQKNISVLNQYEEKKSEDDYQSILNEMKQSIIPSIEITMASRKTKLEILKEIKKLRGLLRKGQLSEASDLRRGSRSKLLSKKISAQPVESNIEYEVPEPVADNEEELDDDEANRYQHDLDDNDREEYY
jgi:hypothetical protein